MKNIYVIKVGDEYYNRSTFMWKVLYHDIDGATIYKYKKSAIKRIIKLKEHYNKIWINKPKIIIPDHEAYYEIIKKIVKSDFKLITIELSIEKEEKY